MTSRSTDRRINRSEQLLHLENSTKKASKTLILSTQLSSRSRGKVKHTVVFVFSVGAVFVLFRRQLTQLTK